MTRPCFLVIDREYSGSISTRKLVIETAKFNVITAYSSAEAIETFRRFPAVNGIVLDAGMRDMSCEALVHELKTLSPTVRIIVVTSPGVPCDGADHYLDSFEPARMLTLLQNLEPEQTAAIAARNETLSAAR